jgi:hypothetical protein
MNGLLKPYYDSVTYRLNSLRKMAACGNGVPEKREINLISDPMAMD